jgi:putative thioredoxin
MSKHLFAGWQCCGPQSTIASFSRRGFLTGAAAIAGTAALGGTAPQAASDLIKETTTQTFVKDVIEESKRQPVLIDFWAPSCGPCSQLTPIIEKAVRAARGKVKLVKMNIDDHPAISGQMGIQSTPAVIAFVNGQPADGFMGAVPESQVTAFIDKLTAGIPDEGEPNIPKILK